MPRADSTYPFPSDGPNAVLREDGIESGFIGKLQGLKYDYRPDITNRAALENNFREKFEVLNRVRLTDAEFARLLDEIVTPDVFTTSKTLRSINSFVRDDGTPLNYSLVNLKDWCKNHFEVINQLRINTNNSHHRYDVILLINGVPCVQIELKTLGVNPRRAMEQIVSSKNDPGNGYTVTLLCAAATALTLEDKLASQKQIKNVEAQRNEKRRSLFEAQDAIDQQREDLIGKIEGKLQQGTALNPLFSVRWNLK